MRAATAMMMAMPRRVGPVTRAARVFRSRDLARHGIARTYLRIAEQEGVVIRAGRGLYLTAGAELTEHHSLAEAAVRSPRAVICLLSALRFHGIGTQNPHEVWIAIGNKDRAPKSDNPRLRTVRFSGASLEKHQEKREIEGVEVKIYSVAKTVADCFKFRNKIGLDVAIEALRDTLRQRKANPAEILEAAEACRVARVMRPYLEALA